MKLLLDQNLSRRLIPALSEAFPESTHVTYLDMANVPDRTIWEYARTQGFAIVTQDSDFHEYNLLAGGPPLVIWLKCGNQRKDVILGKLMGAESEIKQAALDDDIWCIEIY